MLAEKIKKCLNNEPKEYVLAEASKKIKADYYYKKYIYIKNVKIT